MMAKDVVRMRGQITKFYKMRAQMQSASMQMQVRYFYREGRFDIYLFL